MVPSRHAFDDLPIRPFGRIAQFYDNSTGLEDLLKIHPSWHNVVDYERAYHEHPDWLDYLDPESPLYRIKSFSTDLYRHFFGPFCVQSPAGTILDAGCGNGRFWNWFRQWARKIVAFDASASQIACALSHVKGEEGPLHVTCADTDYLSTISSNSIDVVWALEFLCYVDGPETVLDDLVRVTRPSGLLCLSVEGKSAALAMRERMKKKAFAGGRNSITLPGELHLHYFNKDSLAEMCTRRGLQILAAASSHFLVEGIFWQDLDEGRLDDENYRQQAILTEERLGSDPETAEWGRSLMIACRKPEAA